MQNIKFIPFHDLIIRKHVSYPDPHSFNPFKSLVDSIATYGLLQPLVVMGNGHGKFEVIFGENRAQALQQLIPQRKFAEDTPVACTVVNDFYDDAEMILAEVLCELADTGMTARDIAARFRIAESMVIKLMKLGRVSPEVLQAYHGGRIHYAHVQAFTFSDDREAQNKVLESILADPRRACPHTIRSALAEGEIPVIDGRVIFVGLKFYEQCGGRVRRDLFDEERYSYVQDTDLLVKLMKNKFQPVIDELKKEGWKWVETFLDDYWKKREEPGPDCNKFMQLEACGEGVYIELTPEEQQKRKSVEEELYGYKKQIYTGGLPESPEIATHMAELRSALNALARRTTELMEWSPAWKALTGVLLSVGYYGEIITKSGLVKEEDIEAVHRLVPPKPTQKVYLCEDDCETYNSFAAD